MAQSIATAYVDIMPSTRGLKAALEKEVTPVAKQVGTSTGKAMGDAITAETSRGVGPAMKKVLSDAATEGKVTFRTKIKGIGASLSDEFNSTGKISGTLRTVGESMGVTGEKARTLTNAFGQVTGATRAMGGGLSSVTSLLGGPWGIAIAGAGIALGSFAQAQDNARKAGEALAATLDPKTGAATAATYQDVAKSILDNFSSEDLKKTPFTLAEITRALVEGGDRLVDLKARIIAARDAARGPSGFASPFGEPEQYARLSNAVINLEKDQVRGIETNQAARDAMAAAGEAASGAGGKVTGLGYSSEVASRRVLEIVRSAEAAGLEVQGLGKYAYYAKVGLESIPGGITVTVSTNLAQVISQAAVARQALVNLTGSAAGGKYSAGAALNDYLKGINNGTIKDPIAAAKAAAKAARLKAKAEREKLAAKARAAAGRTSVSSGGSGGAARANPLAGARDALRSSITGTFAADLIAEDVRGIDKVFAREIELVRKALSGKKESALVALLKKDNVALRGLASQRATVAKELATKESELSDLRSRRSSIASSVTTSGIGDLTGARSASGLQRVLGKQLAAVKAWGANMRALAKRGLPQAFLEQLFNKGLDGAATAAALVRSSETDFATIKGLTNNLTAESSKLGADAGSLLYDTGIATMQGLISGLKSQDKALEAQMLTIAKSMQKAIRKALGIKSPSQVFRALGAYIPQGLAKGIDDNADVVNRSVVGMVRIPQQRPTAAGAGQAPIHQTFQVYGSANPLETAHAAANEMVWRSKR